MSSIGLLFGSFNPLHNGHLQLAQIAQSEVDLDEVWFVVQPQNSYKPVFTFLDYEARKQLIIESGLKLYEPSTSNYPHFILETLHELPEHDLTLILGEDLAGSFSTWSDYKQIKEQSRVYKSHRHDELSSGTVRDRIRDDQPVDDLVPAAVASYLDQHPRSSFGSRPE